MTKKDKNTLEVLTTYKVKLAEIIGCDVKYIKIFVKIGSSKEIEVGTIDYDKDKVEKSFELGEYRITQSLGDNINRNLTIATFKLYQLQHCCAYMVSANAFVNDMYRKKGIGTLMNKLRQDIGRLLGYTAILCTDVEKNTGQRRILEKNGWKDIHKLKNKRTGNTVFLSVIDLT